MQFHVVVRVLLCVDNDPVLDAVVAAVDALIDVSKCDEVCVFHVVPSWPPFLVDRRHDPRTVGESIVTTVAERLSSLPARVRTVVATGAPAEAIARAAETDDMDLVVMGARGTTGEFPVGSVSQKVVSISDSDVLVVRPSEAPLTDFRTLITVDGSRASEAGITSFANKLRAARADIHLVHVIESMPSLWEVGSREHEVSEPLVRHAEELLARAASLLAARGLDAECEWHHGSPAERILHIARHRKCALIVIGSRGHSQLRQLLLGPMTQRILRHAPCTVLCARAWSPEWAALTSEWSSDGAEPQIGMA